MMPVFQKDGIDSVFDILVFDRPEILPLGREGWNFVLHFNIPDVYFLLVCYRLMGLSLQILYLVI